MAEWHGYFVSERLNIGSGNWDTLCGMFEGMGSPPPPPTLPCYLNHWRMRLDGDAVIYEAMFAGDEVSMPAFKQLLADTFSVPVENIFHETSYESYAGGTTIVWTFYYPEIGAGYDRFKVERFASGGSTWLESLAECLGYLVTYQAEWEPAGP